MYYKKQKKKLGNILVEEGVITAEQLEFALKEQKKRRQRLGELLVDLGFTDEMTIAKALQSQLCMEYIQLTGIHIEKDITDLVSEHVLRKHQLIPFEFNSSDSNILRVAVADPLDLNAIDDIRMITNYQVEVVIAAPSEIVATIDRYYGNAQAKAVAERYSQEKERQLRVKDDNEQVANDINQSPIVVLVKTTIEQAIRQRASDIHIEPMEKQIRIRYRIDGALYEIMRYEINLLSAIVTRM